MTVREQASRSVFHIHREYFKNTLKHKEFCVEWDALSLMLYEQFVGGGADRLIEFVQIASEWEFFSIIYVF